MSNSISEIVAVCRDASTAWEATCALLDLAETQDVHRSVWDGSDEDREEAEAVRASLVGALEPAGGTERRDGTNYDPTSVGDAISATSTPLTLGQLAHVVATVLDQMYWPSFTRDWLAHRGPTFDLHSGERYPIGKMRLMGALGYSSLPDRLGLLTGELAHVRRRGSDEIRVIVNGEYAGIIDGLLKSPPLEAAALLPNESWSELTTAPGQIGPADTTAQESTIVNLLAQAKTLGVAVVVIPELSVDENILAVLDREWSEATNLPMLFAGSIHLVDGDQRVNRTTVLLPGVGAAWNQDKNVAFEDREGNREPIDPCEPCITLGCGDLVRVATLICKDALSPEMASLIAELGVHLLVVPAMSDRLWDFSNVASQLIARSQGATVVANNPRLWDHTNVEHALLGHPVQGDNRLQDRHSAGAPDLGVARLGLGWV